MIMFTSENTTPSLFICHYDNVHIIYERIYQYIQGKLGW